MLSVTVGIILVSNSTIKNHQKEIDISISKNDMHNLLLLCTKNVHFCFSGDIYQQNDDVAMGSPLGPFLASIFMVELEMRIMPTVTDNISGENTLKISPQSFCSTYC